MVPVMSLWLPIVVSAVIVFFASFLMHMVLKYHRGDMRRFPNEDEVMDALRRFNIPPGDYGMPMPGSAAGMRSPEFIAKMTKGPVAFVTVRQPGPPAMGKALGQWFVYLLVVNFFAAYVTGRAVGPGVDYLTVFRFIGTTAFMGFSLALLQASIWASRNWMTTFRGVFDGLVYACLTAGTFGWLWPR